MRAYLLRRVNLAICPWISDPIIFWDLLGTSRSVVGGSVALRVAVQGSWLPNDLNIFCPRGQLARLSNYLEEKEGYWMFVSGQPRIWNTAVWPKLDVIRGSRSFRKFRRPSLDGSVKKITLIESQDGYAISPIIQSCTLMMNWITAEVVCVGYPVFTLNHKGVMDRRYGSESEGYLRLYERREFSWTRSWDWVFESTHHGAACPGVLRSSDDRMNLVMSFAEEDIWREGRRYWQYPRKVWLIGGVGHLGWCRLTSCASYGMNSAYALGKALRRHYYKASIENWFD